MADRRPMGALEDEVLACLWRSREAMTPGEVLEALDDDLAYTTVMTILTRLWEKGLAERAQQGRAYAYRPSMSEAELTARRMRDMLSGVSNRRAALSTFVGSLPKRDANLLRAAIRDLESS